MTGECWCLCISTSWKPEGSHRFCRQGPAAVLGLGTLLFHFIIQLLKLAYLNVFCAVAYIAALQAGRSWAKWDLRWAKRFLCPLHAIFQMRAQRVLVVLEVFCYPCEWHVLTSEDVSSSALASIPVSSGLRRNSLFCVWSFQLTQRSWQRQRRLNWPLICCLRRWTAR